MKGIGGGFQIIFVFLSICCNFFIHSKITLFGGQNLVQIYYLLRELFHQLSISQIDSYMAVILEYHWMVYKLNGFWKIFQCFWRISFFFNFTKNPKKSNKCHHSKTIKDFETLIDACQTTIKSSAKKILRLFSKFFPDIVLF